MAKQRYVSDFDNRPFPFVREIAKESELPLEVVDHCVKSFFDKMKLRLLDDESSFNVPDFGRFTRTTRRGFWAKIRTPEGPRIAFIEERISIRFKPETLLRMLLNPHRTKKYDEKRYFTFKRDIINMKYGMFRM
jgi:nucleoid DNA-binding protein